MTHVQSSLWYRAFLTSDQIAAGGLTMLCEQFAVAVNEAGEPEGACLVAIIDEVADSESDDPSGEQTAILFFSPTAISLGPCLLASHDARPSDPPQRPRATLLVGRGRLAIVAVRNALSTAPCVVDGAAPDRSRSAGVAMAFLTAHVIACSKRHRP